MKKRFSRIILSIVIVASPILTFAWSSSGHRTAGTITYYYLKQNSPGVIPKVVQTLANHPWYNTRWKDSLKNLQGEQREIELFMLASTFPDDARPTDLGNGEKFKWHYVANPYVPAGEAVQGKEAQSPNAQEKIIELLGTLKTEKEGEQKALDVCWIFHLIEDVHQPLHTACLYDKNHPDGDNVGNKTFIKMGQADAEKLHHFWDFLPVEDGSNCIASAKDLFQRYPEASLDELKIHTDPVSWIKDESYPLAIKYAYMGGKINGTRENPTIVDESYKKNSKPITERRLVLSSIRLAKELMKIYS